MSLANLAWELRWQSWAVLTDHNIDSEVFDDVRRQAQQFFDQPIENKLEYDIRASQNHRGYVPVTEAGAYGDEGGIRRYEAFDVGGELDPTDALVAVTPLLGANEWPTEPKFKSALRRCFDALDALTQDILDTIAIDLEVSPQVIRDHRKMPLSQMRCINYFDRPANAPTHVAMGAHTDYEFITIIKQWSPGLEVHSEGAWTDAVCPPDGLIVLVGDLLETLSGGLYRSALHRIPDLPGTRFSLPFFAGGDYSATVRPVVGDMRYPAIHAGPHILRQLQRDFPYLRARYPLPADIDLDESAQWESSFEQRHRTRAN